jgi:hypothetical protein
MKKQLLYLIICLFLSLNSYATYYSGGCYQDSINDGPYIFYVNDNLKVTWIKNSALKEKLITPENFAEIKKRFNLLCNYKDLTDSYLLKPVLDRTFRKIDSISVISDIHGEYDIYINLLKASGIIDKNLNWKFGKGHLVVLGDVFDRGEMVTEVLWHLFGLEKQAAEAGGMVQVLIGNHELLVLSKDLRYINEKYKEVEKLSGTKYFDLYSENSVLGKWLRSKPVMITINDIIFVHGGISIELVNRSLSIRQINNLFSNKIIGKDMELVCEDEELLFLSDTFGPIWYRGYFTDATFCESRLDSILDFYNKKHIVVGHTTYKDIQSHFKNKILGVDAGISMDQPGKMLIYKDGFFYKGYSTGKRIKL